jgi:type II secretory ATPase GspE/PulE/Tfp pilus assembly ATPase PilB-like protein
MGQGVMTDKSNMPEGMKSQKIGALLLEKRLVTRGELALGLAVQECLEPRERLGSILCEYDLLNDAELAMVLALQSGCGFLEGEITVHHEAALILGKAFMQAHGVCPVMTAQGLVFVMADPYDMMASDHVFALFGAGQRFMVAAAAAVMSAVDKFTDDALGKALLTPAGIQEAALALLDQAVGMKATDIHIEPSGRAVDVRMRVDGVLRFIRSFPLSENARLVNIFLSRAQISAGDFLRCHDGRFDHVSGRRKVDVRLSHIPSVSGPSLVLRILDRTRAAPSLEVLGYSLPNREVIGRALAKPHGITLVTGPTGCGKTTTIYAMLGLHKSVGVKVVAVEDPVEVRLPLVTQVAVDIRKGHDFHQVARAFLRHDPDILLIGEIRDEKTAAEATRAAITGHRVLSTLHTNNAASAILRLKDLGVDMACIANTLTCVVAQRLVRTLCRHCRQEELATPLSVPAAVRDYITGPGQVVYRPNPAGCPHCFEGFSGRTVVAEALFVDDQMRFMIEQGLVHEICVKAREKDAAATMRADALTLIRDGVISPEEAARVVG